MKILVTGFDPFGGEPINPALEAVKALPDTILGAEVIKLEIPTVFGKSAEVVKSAILAEKPDVVLAIGQAGGRFSITPERIAINVDDARIPDNEAINPSMSQYKQTVPRLTLRNYQLKRWSNKLKRPATLRPFQIVRACLYATTSCTKFFI